MPPTVARFRLAAAGVMVFGMLAACGGGESDEGPDTTPAAEFELPDGVELTEAGAELGVGDTGTFAYEVSEGTGSAVTATVDSIEEGDVEEDFEFFTLDEASAASTPYYVTATLTNDGPAGLGAIAPPFVVEDDQNSIAPPNNLNGSFPVCEPRQMPETLLPGNEAKICMVFLIPEGRSLVSINARTADPSEAISWMP